MGQMDTRFHFVVKFENLLYLRNQAGDRLVDTTDEPLILYVFKSDEAANVFKETAPVILGCKTYPLAPSVADSHQRMHLYDLVNGQLNCQEDIAYKLVYTDQLGWILKCNTE